MQHQYPCGRGSYHSSRNLDPSGSVPVFDLLRAGLFVNIEERLRILTHLKQFRCLSSFVYHESLSILHRSARNLRKCTSEYFQISKRNTVKKFWSLATPARGFVC